MERKAKKKKDLEKECGKIAQSMGIGIARILYLFLVKVCHVAVIYLGMLGLVVSGIAFHGAEIFGVTGSDEQMISQVSEQLFFILPFVLSVYAMSCAGIKAWRNAGQTWGLAIREVFLIFAASIYVYQCGSGEEILITLARSVLLTMGFRALGCVLKLSWETGKKYSDMTQMKILEGYRLWNKERGHWEKGNVWIGLDGCLMTLRGEDTYILDKYKYVIQRSTGISDISGRAVYEGDIIESHLGGNVLALNMLVKYGAYQAYCPGDQAYMDNIGFYISAKGYPDMPVGPLQDYALVIGNVLQNPELISEEKE